VVATGAEFKLLHVNDLDGLALASPALVGERLLIRTEHRMYSIRSRKSAGRNHHTQTPKMSERSRKGE